MNQFLYITISFFLIGGCTETDQDSTDYNESYAVEEGKMHTSDQFESAHPGDETLARTQYFKANTTKGIA